MAFPSPTGPISGQTSAPISAASKARFGGVVNLSVALMFFERSYNRITDLTPTFIELSKGRVKTDDEDYT